jgi:hypothetical protein
VWHTRRALVVVRLSTCTDSMTMSQSIHTHGLDDLREVSPLFKQTDGQGTWIQLAGFTTVTRYSPHLSKHVF